MPLSNVRTILHPTDFSDASLVAFVHALKLTLALGAELELFHVEPDNTQTDWHWGPNVRATLERWGVLAEGSTDADLARLNIRIRRGTASGVAADKAIFEELAASHADLVVMATHGRLGLQRWLQPSVSTPVVTRGSVPVLVLPPNQRGFIDPASGHSGLDRCLVPVAKSPAPKLAFDAAEAMLRALGRDAAEIATLHVGPELPEAKQLFAEGREVQHLAISGGDPVDVILREATSWNADLLVMSTEGRTNFLDNLRGSTVERVIARLTTPLLVVPAAKK